MKVRKISLTYQLIFIAIFTVLGLVSLQLPLTQLVGSKAKFTLFDMLAPTVGAFVGVLPGMAAVLAAQAINTVIHGGFVDIGAFIRPFPTLFAVWYFAKKSRRSLFVPLLAILAFNLHPIGSKVWYYSLFWTIPLLAHFLRKRLLLARSLGATFTAHAVGGALWIWTFNLPAEVWQGLIPVVIMERGIFAVGISVVYVVLNNVLAYLVQRNAFPLPFQLEKRYLFKIKLERTDCL